MTMQTRLTGAEKRTAISIATIFSFRMLGLFMILPVFALYAEDFSAATPLLIGLAIGIYGLTQALLQIPFGMLSDRIGRKPVILTGLIIFAIGSWVAAEADTIYMIIFGRALQGAGAIAAAMMALLSDLTREEHRTKAMATIGMSIGFSFIGAMVLGPIISSWWGISGIFYLTAGMAIVGIIILFLVVPTPRKVHFHHDTEADVGLFLPNLRDRQLLRIDGGIFILHSVLTACFIAVPHLLQDSGIPLQKHWQIYLPVMILAMGAMIPFIIIAEKHGKMKPIFVAAIFLLFIDQIFFSYLEVNVWFIAIMLGLFFAAFNLLEAMLPSMVAKFAAPASRGTAMGIYSTSQFMGAFFGGISGGWSYQYYGASGLFTLNAILLFIWFLAARTMQSPRQVASRMIHIGCKTESEVAILQQQLAGVPGVVEIEIDRDEETAFLKIETGKFDEMALENIMQEDEK